MSGPETGIGDHPVPAARLLDLTRLISRVGRGPMTGIDRVEFAYLTQLLREQVPLFALVRTRLGYLLLDRAGAEAVAARLRGDVPWGRAAALTRRIAGSDGRARAETDLRLLALARATRWGLARCLRRHLPEGSAYLNVGHANLTEQSLKAIGQGAGLRIAVMIHDTIPLDLPQFASPGVPERFAAMLNEVGARADLVIYNSNDTKNRAEAHLRQWGRLPASITAHLGIDLATPDPAAIPAIIPRNRAYFLSIGTIEPRKNHGLLLDLWEDLIRTRQPEDVPALILVGNRGWNNDVLFDRLDSAPYMGKHVFEVSNLADSALSALLRDAVALLFPSHAEGYGLPAAEAASLGLPLICNDLAVYREVMGDYPVYAEASDRYLWAQHIDKVLSGVVGVKGTEAKAARSSQEVPTWSDHFKTVLRLT